MKEKTDKLNFIKIKNFSEKDTISLTPDNVNSLCVSLQETLRVYLYVYVNVIISHFSLNKELYTQHVLNFSFVNLMSL